MSNTLPPEVVALLAHDIVDVEAWWQNILQQPHGDAWREYAIREQIKDIEPRYREAVGLPGYRNAKERERGV